MFVAPRLVSKLYQYRLAKKQIDVFFVINYCSNIYLSVHKSYCTQTGNQLSPALQIICLQPSTKPSHQLCQRILKCPVRFRTINLYHFAYNTLYTHRPFLSGRWFLAHFVFNNSPFYRKLFSTKNVKPIAEQIEKFLFLRTFLFIFSEFILLLTST